MYIQYFGLRENPFALPPDPRYLYLGVRHQEALAHLMYGITEGGGFVQLTGEVGTGKTMTVRALFDRLPETVDIALVLYPFLSVHEFIAAICDDLDIACPDGNSLKGMIDALNAYLLDNHAKGRRTVLVVDEAHKLSLHVLEQIRLLTNLETTKEKLLQIILVGQPELNQMLARQDLRQLAQRITARYDLKALTWDECCEYVLHRCRIAGAQMPLFSRSALRAVYRMSNGIPRLVNTLCDRALLGAYAVGKSQVTAALVRKAAREVKPSPPGIMRRAWHAAAFAGIATIAAGVVAWQLFGSPATAPEETPVAAVEDGATSVAASPEPAVEPSKAETKAEEKQTALDTVLADANVPTDTDTAFTRLFSYWQKDYAKYSGPTGCDRALQAGLRCLFESGTWNNLRQLNRPAIIELTDARGSRHHVLVSSLKQDSVTLELGDRTREYALADVDRFWFGKYLAVWSPPEGNDQPLRRGTRGPGVVWLRSTLSRAGLLAQAERTDIFDAPLEEKVKEFQRRHQVEEDGIVGRMTMILLTTYDKVSPPLLAHSQTTATP
jgi:general secretion pathway protein A